MGRYPLRLRALVRWIEPGWRVADIGTDHALLPRALVQSGRASHVIGVEILPHVVHALKAELRHKECEGKVEVRQGSGLTPLAPGEVDAVVIAGLGVSTVCAILDEAGQKLASYKRLLVVPTDEAAPLRRWLYRHSIPLLDEAIVWDKGRGYEILIASLAAYGDRLAARAPYDDLLPLPLHLLFSLGPYLSIRRSKEWQILWQRRLSRRAERLGDLRHARTAQGMRRYQILHAAYFFLARALEEGNFSSRSADP